MTSMSVLPSKARDPARSAQVGGLAAGAVGLVIEVVSGVQGFPIVPPGPIILVVAAGFVALAPWRWAPILGLAAAVFLTVGQAVTPNFGGSFDRLGDVGAFGPFAGTALFLLGLLVALAAGVVATFHGLRRR
jgi:hypothetical protein